MRAHIPPPRAAGLWRRRIRHQPAPQGRWLRAVQLGRSLRMLGLLLVVTGCAIEPPHPDVPGVAAPPLPRFVPPPIISGFGDWHGAGGVPRPWQHSGVDIRVPTGTPVLAAADGVVVRTGWGPFAGRYVLLAHAPDLGTAYYHLSEVAVRAGQAVRRGERIGLAGMTGNATTPHLHFGVCRRDGSQCGGRIDDGWADPERLWLEPGPCFVPGRPYPADPARLSYPVPCTG